MTACRSVYLVAVILFGCPALAAELAVETSHYKAEVAGGAVVRLHDAQGRTLVRLTETPVPTLAIERIAGPSHSSAAKKTQRSPLPPATVAYAGFADLPEAAANVTYGIDKPSGDLLLSGAATAPQPGVWGMSWSIGTIPLEYSIIVPGNSGIRLAADAPVGRMTFDYPLAWEAQLVIVEGPGHGFYVWAEDAQGRYKRLMVERGREGWQLRFTTINDAPFDTLTKVESVRWRMNVYQGDWRVPARRYRDWMQEHFRPTPLAQQQPAWVRDIRCLVTMGQNLRELEQLAQRIDPRQTLLYLPGWRTPGYDRDYPDYKAVLANVEPFVRRAHELGFRVMVHTNYFGVDPLHAEYARFEPYQVRSPWGKHEKLWWLWTKTTPEIKFAYINPALAAWRENFTSAMVDLCRRLPIDALHLDQTLCIYNDHNGRIEGHSMLEGNELLHRRLREALPNVALSGEGLNEVTCRHEAFAQRHAWGLNHAEGTFDCERLKCAHPISSYLFVPYTTINGYLGYVSPNAGPLYAAWNEAYEHWGVIPTFMIRANSLTATDGFTRQWFDEAAAWFQNKLVPDLDGPWPADTAFPFRTATGRPAARTTDGRLVVDGRTVGRTITGRTRVDDAGCIPGWPAYDGRRAMGLDPQAWYPCFNETPDADAFHVCDVPEGIIVTRAVAQGDVAVVRTAAARRIVADLIRELPRARCSSRPVHGPATEVWGPLNADDGGHVTPASARLAMHPPYRKTPGAAPATPGDGRVSARYEIALPREGRFVFTCGVALDKNATGPQRSDGVLFLATAGTAADAKQLRVEHLQISEVETPLSLDLTPLAGQTIVLELTADPGPKRSASFDWARWVAPRIEQYHEFKSAALSVAGKTRWGSAMSGARSCKLVDKGDRQSLELALPGSLCLVKGKPAEVALPVDLATAASTVLLLDSSGRQMSEAAHAGVRRTSATVGGQTRTGLRIHPPDHGQTIAQYVLRLPDRPAAFRCGIGIADGSHSTGVVFAVEVNGVTLAERRMLPGRWEDLAVSLKEYAGQPVVFSLVTDSDGPFNFDWAFWASPRLEPEEP